MSSHEPMHIHDAFDVLSTITRPGTTRMRALDSLDAYIKKSDADARELAAKELELRDLRAKLEADARALWALRCLDAWEEQQVSHPFITQRSEPDTDSGRWCCWREWIEDVDWVKKPTRFYYGATADAARIAAATVLVAADPSLRLSQVALSADPADAEGAWIPVTDLPAPYQVVQFLTTANEVCVGPRVVDDGRWEDMTCVDGFGESAVYGAEQVTHWAPLLVAPKPPEQL